MKPAFDKTAPGEETLGLYDKLERVYDRTKVSGHKLVVAFRRAHDSEEYSVAQVSRASDMNGALDDLDNFCFAFNYETAGEFQPLAVLNMDEPYERQMRGPEAPDEGYLRDPVINLPDRAKGYEDIAKIIYGIER